MGQPATPYSVTEKVVVINGVATPQLAGVFGPPEWTQTLCGCTENWSICCEECWCAYCHLGYLYDTVETGGRDMDPIVCCGTLCIDYFIGGIARCLVIMHLRNRLTAKYRIEEGGVKTCCTACWCSSCAMCQMHREMETRHEYTGGCCYKGPEVAAPMGGEQPHNKPGLQTQPYDYTNTNTQQQQQMPPPQQQPYQPQYVQPGYAPPPHQQQPMIYQQPPPQQQQMYQPQPMPPQQGYAPSPHAPPPQQIYQQPYQETPAPLGLPPGQYSHKTV